MWSLQSAASSFGVASAEYADRVTFVGINADENREIMNMFGISRSKHSGSSKSQEPGAKVVAQAIGVKPRHEYIKLLERRSLKLVFCKLFGVNR